MGGPIAAQDVAEIANSARPTDCVSFGSNVMIGVNAIGISTPLVDRCTARSTIICGRSCASAQAAENTRNRIALVSR
jgi:hypothetical protein